MPDTAKLKIGGHDIAVSNPDKVFYNAGKFTKLDVIQYYLAAAAFLLPHFRNRPVTLKRYPNGVHGEVFYEKDAPGYTPEWIRTFPVPRREGGPDINYILINDRATLAWTANAAALELHPFLHRIPGLDLPTHVVFDLDPGEGAALPECIEVALILRDILAKLKLKSFPKVSGSKGLQLYVPLNTPTSYNSTQLFAKTIAELLEREHGDLVVAEMSKNLRHNKVFIDWSQNADHKTTVGVYSLRAKSNHPYVSMPVKWRELEKPDVDALYFEARPALKRLNTLGDLFLPVLKLKQNLPAQFRDRPAGGPVKEKGSSKALSEYAAKRNFSRTAEPGPSAPQRSRQGSRRRFVIQKHAASHLHYDFRLEMNDVLKSWAVPKNLSLKEAETRTGFETEDHPVDYLEFEGIIPEGEYGGGTVMVWDIGTYEVVDGNYWKGALTVFLSGRKLKGEWTVTRAPAEEGKPRWFIRKTNGDAKAIAKKREATSAITKRTMEQIAGDRSAVWNSNVGGASVPRQSKSKKGSGRKGPSYVRKAKVPAFVKPMKATAVTEFPTEGDWIYEVKWDGYRALALKHEESVRLLSLKERNLTGDFPTVADAMRELRATSALLDGEIVAVDAQGRPSFQVLQNRKTLGRGWTVVYYAFDLLNIDGQDLLATPLHERKARLKHLIAGSASPIVRYSAELSGTPAAVIRTVAAAGLEGVVAKQRESLYRAGTRVTSWLKLKLNKGQEFVIGGYKPDARSFQSILVGYYEAKKLIFAGKVRQGFNPVGRARLLEEMKPHLVKACPFANLPTSRKSHFGEGITTEEMAELCWLNPKLVAQVSFTEWTNYGLLRHATFEGLRDDKTAREVVREPQ